MESESEQESIEGLVEEETIGEGPAAAWGKTKFNYYFTDYVDKDYPSNLTRKEERLAAIEQDEALRLQKKLDSTIDNVNLQPFIDYGESDDDSHATRVHQEDLIQLIENQNKTLIESKNKDGESSKKRKRVTFAPDDMGECGSDECEFNDEDDVEDEDEDDNHDDEDDDEISADGRRRRPINVAIKKNRGLTPYKKKEFRNPRVKHKLKYKKAMTKRRRLVKEAKTEFHRYSGESTGIKTSTIRSIKLC